MKQLAMGYIFSFNELNVGIKKIVYFIESVGNKSSLDWLAFRLTQNYYFLVIHCLFLTESSSKLFRTFDKPNLPFTRAQLFVLEPYTILVDSLLHLCQCPNIFKYTCLYLSFLVCLYNVPFFYIFFFSQLLIINKLIDIPHKQGHLFSLMFKKHYRMPYKKCLHQC